MRFPRPPGFHDPVSEAFAHLRRVGAIGAVYLDASGHCDEAEHIVAVNGVAAFRQLEFQPFQVLVDDEHILLAHDFFLSHLQVISLRAAVSDLFVRLVVALLLFDVFIQNGIGVESPVGYLLVELRDILVPHPFDKAHHGRFVVLYLPVLELAFQRLFGKVVLPRCHLFQCLAYLGARSGGGYDIQPILFRGLRVGCHDLHLIAAVQLLFQLHVLPVYFRAYAFASQLGVDMEGEVEHRRPFAQFEQIAFGSEYEHLVFVQIHLELIHHFQRVAVRVFQRFAHRSQPFVQSAFSFYAFVPPVRRESSFGYLVHASRAYLHFHPFPFGAHHGDVERLVTVALRNRKPVAQPLGVGLVHVGDDGVCLPALLLLLHRIGGGVDNDADGEQVVYPFERCFLLLNLVPDGVDGFRPPFDVELQSRLRYLPFDRFDERRNVFVARGFRLVELVFDEVISVGLRILQRQILQLRLQLIEPQLMGQRRVKIRRFVCHPQPVFFLFRIFNPAHDVHTVGDHDEYHPHVFGKREKQVPEVFRLDGGAFLIQFVGFHQSLDDTAHIFSELVANLPDAQYPSLYDLVEHDAGEARPFHPDLFGHDDGGLHIPDHGIHAETVALQSIALHRFGKMLF